MLRPGRSLPPQRLVTVRLGLGLSTGTTDPATRRSGAYLGGTCTRWDGAA